MTTSTSPESRKTLLELVGVSRVFDGTPPLVALHEVDLSIEAGDYVSIVGPSGSGKSTLLNLFGLMDRPTTGEYLFDGVPTSQLSDVKRAEIRAIDVGFVFQAFHLLMRRSALENVMLATAYGNVPREEREPRARHALEKVGLSSRLDYLPGTLSGGERQRVAVARAIVSSPRLLLADEPTGNLDQARAGEIMQLCESLVDDGITLVVITHDSAIAARAPARIRITDGRVYRS